MKSMGPIVAKSTIIWVLIGWSVTGGTYAQTPADQVAKLRAIEPQAATEPEGTWQGTLDMVVADDFLHRRSETQYYLVNAKERVALSWGANAPMRAGERVTVHGRRQGNRIGVTSADKADAIPQTPTAPEYNNPIGVQHMAVFLVTTPSNPSFPAGLDYAFWQHEFFSTNPGAALATGSLNDFIGQASYGKTSITGQVFGPFAINQEIDCNTIETLTSLPLINAVAAAAGTSVDMSQYNRLAYIFPSGSCTFAGLGTIGVGAGDAGSTFPASSYEYSTMFIPVFSGEATGDLLRIISHEFGHNLGLMHGHSADFGNAALASIGAPAALAEYGDPFSTMGAGFDASGTSQGNLTAAGEYPAYQKAFLLNWLGPSDFTEVTSSGAFQLQPYESATGTRALRVRRDPASQTWLWLEYRQPNSIGDSSFNTLNFFGGTNVYSGVLVHYEDPALQEAGSQIVTMNPVATPNSFLNAALTPGTTWKDPYSLLSLSVSSPETSGLTVNVTYDQPCATLTPASTAFPATQSSGSIVVTADSSCSWNVSSSGGWVNITSAASGTGNGIVTFSLSENDGGLARIGYITIQRQTVAINQQSSYISYSSVIPASGQGSEGTFTFQFTDTKGFADLVVVFIDFLGSPGCHLIAGLDAGSSSDGSVALFNYAGQFWNNIERSAILELSSPGGVVSNEACSISSDGSSITGNGNSLQIKLLITFFEGSGTYRIIAQGDQFSESFYPGGEVQSASYPALLGSWMPIVAGPTITSVANAASFAPAFASSSWVAIQGGQLAATTRSWSASDFNGSNLPTQLDGVSVKINGLPAYLSYISPGQINVLAPDDPATGPVSVQVTNSNGASNIFMGTKQAIAPAFFQLLPGIPVAVHADGSLVGSTADGEAIGVPATPASTGETIVLYGTGFGPTSSPAPAGQLIATPAQLANNVTVDFGFTPAQVKFAGRAASGLDQLNVVVPPGFGSANGGTGTQINVTVGGVATPFAFIFIN